MNIFFARYWVLCVASVLGALAIACPSLWFVAPFALGAFWYDIGFLTHSRNTAFIKGLLFGFATGGAGILWAWQALPFDWLGIASPFGESYTIAAVWFLVSLALAFPIAMLGGLFFTIRNYRVAFFIAPLLWVVGEYGRMWAFAVIAYGNQSLVGPHFSIAAIGYALAENNYLLQLAYPYGIWALSFVVSLFGVCIALGAKYRTDKTYFKDLVCMTALSLLIVTIPLFEKHPEPQGAHVSFAVLSTQGAIDESKDVRQEYTALMQRAGATTPDVVVIPEGHSLAQLFSTDSARMGFLKKTFTGDVLVMSSGVRTDANGTLHSILSYDTKEGVIAEYQKRFLMPEGEYQPALSDLIFNTVGDATVRSYFDGRRTLTKGDTSIAVPWKGTIIGGLLCSEEISPFLYRELAQTYGAHVLVNLADPTWFHSSPLLFAKNIELAKVHAVANRAYFIESTKGTSSFAVDPYGKIIGMSGWNSNDVFSISIPTGR